MFFYTLLGKKKRGEPSVDSSFGQKGVELSEDCTSEGRGVAPGGARGGGEKGESRIARREGSMATWFYIRKKKKGEE